MFFVRLHFMMFYLWDCMCILSANQSVSYGTPASGYQRPSSGENRRFEHPSGYPAEWLYWLQPLRIRILAFPKLKYKLTLPVVPEENRSSVFTVPTRTFQYHFLPVSLGNLYSKEILKIFQIVTEIELSISIEFLFSSVSFQLSIAYSVVESKWKK